MNTSFNYRRNLISNAVLLQLKNWIHQKLNPSSRGWAYPHPLANHAVMPFSIRQIPSVNSSATNSSLVTASDHLRRFRSSDFQPFSSFSSAGYSCSSPSTAVCAKIASSIRNQRIRTFAFCFLLRLRLSLRRKLLPAASIALVGVNKELHRYHAQMSFTPCQPDLRWSPAKPSKPIKATLRLSREARHLLNFQAILLGTSCERSGYAECL